MLLGERVSAQEAAELGIVNKVVAPEELDRTAGEWATRLAAKSPLLMKLGKDALWRQADLAVEPAWELLRAQLTIAFATDDMNEGVAAFFEKREPAWTGR
jgi:enoyl-CoA hydratase/carnithine racemase